MRAQFILRGSKVKCSIEKEDDLWPVDADKGQISQVVNNLIINAKQAMPDGGDIRIRMRNLHVVIAEVPALKLGDYICIEVRDEGIGISPQNLKKSSIPILLPRRKVTDSDSLPHTRSLRCTRALSRPNPPSARARFSEFICQRVCK